MSDLIIFSGSKYRTRSYYSSPKISWNVRVSASYSISLKNVILQLINMNFLLLCVVHIFHCNMFSKDGAVFYWLVAFLPVSIFTHDSQNVRIVWASHELSPFVYHSCCDPTTTQQTQHFSRYFEDCFVQFSLKYFFYLGDWYSKWINNYKYWSRSLLVELKVSSFGKSNQIYNFNQIFHQQKQKIRFFWGFDNFLWIFRHNI